MSGRMGGVKRWQFWVGVAISLILLYFALRGLHLDELGNAFRQANYWWLKDHLDANRDE